MTFDGRQPLIEEDLWWKKTFEGRRPSKEEDLWRNKTKFEGKRHLMQDKVWWKMTFDGWQSLDWRWLVFHCYQVSLLVSVWSPARYRYRYESLSTIGIGIGMSSSIRMVPIPIPLPGILFVKIPGIGIGIIYMPIPVSVSSLVSVWMSEQYWYRYESSAWYRYWYRWNTKDDLFWKMTFNRRHPVMNRNSTTHGVEGKRVFLKPFLQKLSDPISRRDWSLSLKTKSCFVFIFKDSPYVL